MILQLNIYEIEQCGFLSPLIKMHTLICILFICNSCKIVWRQLRYAFYCVASAAHFLFLGGKKMKRIISLLLLIVVILCIATGCSNQNITNNEDQKNDTVIIEKTTQNLQEHLTDVPEGYIGIYTVNDLIDSDYNRDANYILMNDLDLSSIDDWNGLINNETFDGNNYTISNLKSTKSGLFQIASEIKNLTLKKVNIIVDNEYEYSLGCLSSTAKIIKNCTVYGKLEYKPTNGSISIGGLLGSLNSSMTKCKSYVDILVPSGFNITIGGLVGVSYGGVTINYCNFYSSINAVGDIGGICGKVREGNVTINGCRNDGKIYISEKSGGSDYVGGILGLADDDVTIQNCSNSGNIADNFTHEYSYEYSGIVGYGYDKITIRNCYNTGKISTTDSNHVIGAIAGCDSNYDLNISNCAYLSNKNISITPTKAIFVNCKAMTENEMKDINNYPFDNIDEWKNTDESFPQYIAY